MKLEKLKSLSQEELEKKIDLTKMSTGFLMGIVIVFFVVTINQIIKTGEFDYFILIPIASVIFIVYNFREIKKMEKELKSRG